MIELKKIMQSYFFLGRIIFEVAVTHNCSKHKFVLVLWAVCDTHISAFKHTDKCPLLITDIPWSPRKYSQKPMIRPKKNMFVSDLLSF